MTKHPSPNYYGMIRINKKYIAKLKHKHIPKINIPNTSKYNKVSPKTINTSTLTHPPQKSPHTRVCGMRWGVYKTNSNSNTKTNTKSTNILKTNTNLKINNNDMSTTKTIKHSQKHNVCTNTSYTTYTYILNKYNPPKQKT